MIDMMLVLLRVRWLSFRNALMRGEGRERRRARASLIVSPLVAAGAGWAAYHLLAPLCRAVQFEPEAAAVVDRLPAVGLFAAFWMLLLSGVSVGIQMFYFSRELPLLLTSPVPRRQLFFVRMMESTGTNAILFLMLGGPALLAFGAARGVLDVGFVLKVLAGLWLFCSVPTGLGVVLSILLMRALPVNRMRDVLGALGVALFAALYVGVNAGLRRIDDPVAVSAGVAALARMEQNPGLGVGPWAWFGQSLVGGWGGLVWLAAAALAVMLVVAWIGEALHLRGWASMQEVAERPAARRPGVDSWGRGLGRLAPPVRAVLLKDLRSLLRDMRQVSLFFLPIAVIVVFLMNLQPHPGSRTPAMAVGMALYPILSMITGRIALSAFVSESRAIWLVLVSPADPGDLIRAKLLYTLTLAGPLFTATVIAFGLMRGLPTLDLLMNLAVGLGVMLPSCAIAVGISAAHADFHTEDARMTVTAAGRLITFGLQLACLAVQSVAVIGAWLLEANHLLPTAASVSIGLALFAAAGAGFTLWPLNIGRTRLATMEW